MPLFALSSDPFQSFASWDLAYQHALSNRTAKVVWAIVQFDSLPLYFVFFSQPHGAGGYHAEENVVDNFQLLLGRSTVFAMRLLGRCAIYLSDSPCTVSDQRPSNRLGGWPTSCTAKINMLAEMYPVLAFEVYYRDNFGYMDQVTSPRHLGEVFYNLMNETRIMTLHHDTVRRLGDPLMALSAIERHLFRNVLESFFPRETMTADMLRRVLLGITHLGNDSGFNTALFTRNEKAIAIKLGTTIINSINGKGSAEALTLRLRNDLGGSILERVSPTRRVRIERRNFTETPPTP